MDILLSHGYFLSEDPHELKVMKPYPPLGILSISSYLKERGFDVEIFDSTFGMMGEFTSYLEARRPPVVGLYCTLMTRRTVLEMIAAARSAGAIVVVGGPEPVNYVDEYLSRGAHVVAAGEGEETLARLLPELVTSGPHVLHAVDGIAFIDESGAIVRTPPRALLPKLDEQPFPDREAIDIHHYVRVWREHHGQGAVSLITARGCPYRCAWCSHSVFGYSHRRRTVENVVAELEHIREAYRPDIVWYADDVFTIHHRWLGNYAAELERRGIHMPFETISREDRLNESVIKTLAGMGCYRIWVGAESGSQRILDAMQRRTNAGRVREVVRLLKKYGIETGMFIMLGYEEEEAGDLAETVEHLKEANPDVFLTTVAYPIKGTPYYQRVVDRVQPTKSWETGSDRDVVLAGRKSNTYYSYATRWMVNEVALSRELKSPRLNLARAGKAFINARVGRIGMALNQAPVPVDIRSP